MLIIAIEGGEIESMVKERKVTGEARRLRSYHEVETPLFGVMRCGFDLNSIAEMEKDDAKDNDSNRH